MNAMPPLLELQRGFADVLMAHSDAADAAAWVDGAGLEPTARLAIYRNAVAGNLAASLRTSYPTVLALVGGGFFDAVAERYRRLHPSCCGNLQRFGDAFPEFLQALPEARPLEYLPDIARLDWLRQVSALAPDAVPADAAAMAAASEAEPRRLRIRLHPSLQWMGSPYAVLTLWQWCRSPADTAPRFDRRAEWILLWRDGDDVAMAAVEPATFRCIGALGAGADLASAYAAAAGIDAGFDLRSCLGDLLARGLIVAFNDEDDVP